MDLGKFGGFFQIVKKILGFSRFCFIEFFRVFPIFFKFEIKTDSLKDFWIFKFFLHLYCSFLNFFLFMKFEIFLFQILGFKKLNNKFIKRYYDFKYLFIQKKLVSLCIRYSEGFLVSLCLG